MSMTNTNMFFVATSSSLQVLYSDRSWSTKRYWRGPAERLPLEAETVQRCLAWSGGKCASWEREEGATESRGGEGAQRESGLWGGDDKEASEGSPCTSEGWSTQPEGEMALGEWVDKWCHCGLVVSEDLCVMNYLFWDLFVMNFDVIRDLWTLISFDLWT